MPGIEHIDLERRNARLHEWIKERRKGQEAIDRQFARLEDQLYQAEQFIRQEACKGNGAAAQVLMSLEML